MQVLLYCVEIILLLARWTLVLFKDNCYSLVKESNITAHEGELEVGSACTVKEGRQKYNGEILNIGKWLRAKMICSIDAVHDAS